MRLPQFTAEASLAKTTQRYILAAGAAAETGKVIPQGYQIRYYGDGGYDIYYCFDEGGSGGCFRVAHINPLLSGSTIPTQVLKT
jgi:hypothetical protein